MERNFHGRWWLTSPVHQGDHGGAVKTIAQGMPFVSGGPCECACVFFFYCTRGCGCIEHPAFPAPSSSKAREILAKLGRVAPRDRGGASALLPSLRPPKPLLTRRSPPSTPDQVRGRLPPRNAQERVGGGENETSRG